MTVLQTEARTTDEIVKIARKQIDAFNNGDWEQMRAMLTSDARYHELGTERKIEGPEQIIELFKGWKTAFPDAAGTVTNAVASGDTGRPGGDLEGHAHRPARNPSRNDPGLGQAAGDTRCGLLRLRGRQDQGQPPLLRLDDTSQADRRAA